MNKSNHIFVTAGAMIATLIGSGFATGQEIIQYFVAWGWSGLLGILLIFFAFSFVAYSFLSVGYHYKEQLSKPNDIYRIYAGKWLGGFYDYFSVLFLFLSYSLMIGGAGATIEQQFALPNWTGALSMLIVVVIVVAMGLDSITKVLGSLGPVIAGSAILIGMITIFANWSKIGESVALVQTAVENKTIQVASTSWWLAALNYVGFSMLWITAFLGQQGRMITNEREVGWGGILGSVGFCVSVLVMALAFMCVFGDVAGSQVPTLLLANRLHPSVSSLFSIIVMLGIFTSAVTLLWNVVAAFAEDGSKKSRILTLVIGIIGYFVGTALKFDKLVNIIYVVNGYVGILLIAITIFKTVQWKMEAKKA